MKFVKQNGNTRTLTKKYDTLEEFWAVYPRNKTNAAAVDLTDGLIGIDLDRHNANQDGVAEWERLTGEAVEVARNATPSCRTANNGYHLVYLRPVEMPKNLKSAYDLGNGIELKFKNLCFDGNWQNSSGEQKTCWDARIPCEPTALPESVKDAVYKAVNPTNKTDTKVIDAGKELWESESEIAEPGRNEALFHIAAFLRKTRGLDEDAIYDELEKINATRVTPELEAEELRTIVRSAARYSVSPGLRIAEEWGLQTHETANGRTVVSDIDYNARKIFEHTLGSEITYEEFKDEFLWNGKVITRGSIAEAALSEALELELDKFGVKLNNNRLWTIIKTVAGANKTNIVLDKFDTLATRNVEGDPYRKLAVEWLGCEDIPTNAVFLKTWFNQAVRRAYKPGSDARNTLVFQGPEKVGKSVIASFIGLEASVKPSVFTESISKIPSSAMDTVYATQGYLVAELPEGTVLSESITTLKAFLTNRSDKAALKWEGVTEHPRTINFIITTNDTSFLQDDKNTRFLIMECAKNPEWRLHPEDTFRELLKSDVEDCWAVAIQEWRRTNGKLKCELPEEFNEDQQELVGHFTIPDVLEDLISELAELPIKSKDGLVFEEVDHIAPTQTPQGIGFRYPDIKIWLSRKTIEKFTDKKIARYLLKFGFRKYYNTHSYKTFYLLPVTRVKEFLIPEEW